MDLDNVVVVKTYGGEAEAIIAASRLGSEGIEARLQKDDCGGAYPSLQMAGGVRLLVKREDMEESEKILKGMEAEDSKEAEQQELQVDSKEPKSRLALLIGIFLLGLVAGYFLSPELTNRSRYTGAIKHDRNGGGKPGSIYHYVEGQLARVEEDRNYDSKPDAWHKYVAGTMRSSEYDNNFDGKPDVWVTHKDPFNFIEKVDTDFDGKPDATIFYVKGLKQRVDWHPNDSAIIERRELYENGLLKEALVDTDGDAIFDERITYDPYEKPIRKAKCWIPN